MKLWFIITVLVLDVTSCKKDFLETTPLSEFSSADVWKDKSLSTAFINGIYASIDQSMCKYMLAVYCDEAHRRDNSSILAFNRGEMTADNIIGWQTQPTWNGLYSKIRKCNLFLDNTADAPFDKGSMEGEVRFLRAWFYYQLTSMFGGVPLVKNAYNLTDDFSIARSPYADCVDFITTELDAAAALLPEVQTGANNGRVTKGAALALKARVLLHAASDLHNVAVFPDFAKPELLGYTSGSRADRWRAAKNAAKAVIDLHLYSLHKAEPAPGDSIAGNYTEIFLLKKTSEDIWVKFYTSGTIPNDNNLPVMNGPNGYGGQGNNAVSGNLVDAFEMKDGSRFDWNNPEQAAFPYNNRDARFYADVLFEGAKWGTRPAYSIDLDPQGIVHTGYFERWNASANQMYIEPGIDSRNSPFQPGNSGQTLYLCKKFLDPTSVAVEGGVGQEVPWRHLRYAEVLLNYAEACLELEEYNEARDYINMIRKRAGQPETNETGDALKQRYRNERRIELMYEDHRFFDVRRWMIASETYGPFYKANVLYKLLPDKTTSSVPTIKHEVLETRSWNDKAYFFPILRNEMNKNDLLIQNPGYE
ncbi:MAG: RagB/SusD family nutrient uptake outer membrane protein [Sphingobacteriales bacterium]|nr:RagB/SusD family nutrient uptake outer membrane protein [Sphingobacteriales bacterium]